MKQHQTYLVLRLFLTISSLALLPYLRRAAPFGTLMTETAHSKYSMDSANL